MHGVHVVLRAAVPQEHTTGAQPQDWLQVSQGLRQGDQAPWPLPWQDRQEPPHTPQERGAEKEEEGLCASSSCMSSNQGSGTLFAVEGQPGRAGAL